MKHEMLTYGIATPYVLFNFGTVGSICTDDLKYFISLEHNRTCEQACTFRLTIIYVPDTFETGNPTWIDNLLVSSVRQRVSYKYGYYDYLGVIHEHKQQYVGQVYTYSSDTNIANGTITYTVEGTAYVAQLANKMAEISGTTEPKQPSRYLRNKLRAGKDDGFGWLKQYYECDVKTHTDGAVKIPNLGKGPVLDLIMGNSNNITKNNGTTAKVGGLVHLSNAPLQKSMEELHNAGLLTDSAYAWYQRVATHSQATEFVKVVQRKLGTPFKCYIDDTYVNDKYGTLHYVPGTLYESNSIYEFDYGNTYNDSEVLSFSLNYDGAKALAAAAATDNVTASIDAGGNPIGTSNAIISVNDLSRNTFPTKSGFDEELFLSQEELSSIMLYPYEANMTVLGQLTPNQILDIIYVVVKLNGTEIPHLTGQYQILDVNDSISDSGFTTTFKLVRYIQDSEVQGYMENTVSTSNESDAKSIQEAIDAADNRNKINLDDTSTANNGLIYNRLN